MLILIYILDYDLKLCTVKNTVDILYIQPFILTGALLCTKVQLQIQILHHVMQFFIVRIGSQLPKTCKNKHYLNYKFMAEFLDS